MTKIEPHEMLQASMVGVGAKSLVIAVGTTNGQSIGCIRTLPVGSNSALGGLRLSDSSFDSSRSIMVVVLVLDLSGTGRDLPNEGHLPQNHIGIHYAYVQGAYLCGLCRRPV